MQVMPIIGTAHLRKYVVVSVTHDFLVLVPEEHLLEAASLLAGKSLFEAMLHVAVELIPPLGALPPRGGPVQDPVLTLRVVRPHKGLRRGFLSIPKMIHSEAPRQTIL